MLKKVTKLLGNTRTTTTNYLYHLMEECRKRGLVKFNDKVEGEDKNTPAKYDELFKHVNYNTGVKRRVSAKTVIDDYEEYMRSQPAHVRDKLGVIAEVEIHPIFLIQIT